jgi:hypothetical protein
MEQFDIQSRDVDLTKCKIGDLALMKQSFPDETDETVARFFLARDGNVGKATALLRDHIAWRSQIPPIFKSDITKEMRPGKLYVHGTDKLGHPLLVWTSNRHNRLDRDIKDMEKLFLWWIEEAIRRMPRSVSKFSVLMNRANSSGKPDVELGKTLAGVFQNNFPERIARFVSYPSGFLETSIWAAFKWLADPATREKVVLARNFNQVKEFIDEKYLPTEMGGLSTYEYNPDDFPEHIDSANGHETNGEDMQKAASSPADLTSIESRSSPTKEYTATEIKSANIDPPPDGDKVDDDVNDSRVDSTDGGIWVRKPSIA